MTLGLRACGVEPGDEVIVPAFTFVATAGAVSAIGARPVFADSEPDTLNIDPKSVDAMITARTACDCSRASVRAGREHAAAARSREAPRLAA